MVRLQHTFGILFLICSVAVALPQERNILKRSRSTHYEEDIGQSSDISLDSKEDIPVKLGRTIYQSAWSTEDIESSKEREHNDQLTKKGNNYKKSWSLSNILQLALNFVNKLRDKYAYPLTEKDKNVLNPKDQNVNKDLYLQSFKKWLRKNKILNNDNSLSGNILKRKLYGYYNHKKNQKIPIKRPYKNFSSLRNKKPNNHQKRNKMKNLESNMNIKHTKKVPKSNNPRISRQKATDQEKSRHNDFDENCNSSESLDEDVNRDSSEFVNIKNRVSNPKNQQVSEEVSRSTPEQQISNEDNIKESTNSIPVNETSEIVSLKNPSSQPQDKINLPQNSNDTSLMSLPKTELTNRSSSETVEKNIPNEISNDKKKLDRTSHVTLPLNISSPDPQNKKTHRENSKISPITERGPQTEDKPITRLNLNKTQNVSQTINPSSDSQPLLQTKNSPKENSKDLPMVKKDSLKGQLSSSNPQTAEENMAKVTSDTSPEAKGISQTIVSSSDSQPQLQRINTAKENLRDLPMPETSSRTDSLLSSSSPLIEKENNVKETSNTPENEGISPMPIDFKLQTQDGSTQNSPEGKDISPTLTNIGTQIEYKNTPDSTEAISISPTMINSGTQTEHKITPNLPAAKDISPTPIDSEPQAQDKNSPNSYEAKETSPKSINSEPQIQDENTPTSSEAKGISPPLINSSTQTQKKITLNLTETNGISSTPIDSEYQIQDENAPNSLEAKGISPTPINSGNQTKGILPTPIESEPQTQDKNTPNLPKAKGIPPMPIYSEPRESTSNLLEGKDTSPTPINTRPQIQKGNTSKENSKDFNLAKQISPLETLDKRDQDVPKKNRNKPKTNESVSLTKMHDIETLHEPQDITASEEFSNPLVRNEHILPTIIPESNSLSKTKIENIATDNPLDSQRLEGASTEKLLSDHSSQPQKIPNDSQMNKNLQQPTIQGMKSSPPITEETSNNFPVTQNVPRLTESSQTAITQRSSPPKTVIESVPLKNPSDDSQILKTVPLVVMPNRNDSSNPIEIMKESLKDSQVRENVPLSTKLENISSSRMTDKNNASVNLPATQKAPLTIEPPQTELDLSNSPTKIIVQNIPTSNQNDSYLLKKAPLRENPTANNSSRPQKTLKKSSEDAQIIENVPQPTKLVNTFSSQTAQENNANEITIISPMTKNVPDNPSLKSASSRTNTGSEIDLSVENEEFKNIPSENFNLTKPTSVQQILKNKELDYQAEESEMDTYILSEKTDQQSYREPSKYSESQEQEFKLTKNIVTSSSVENFRHLDMKIQERENDGHQEKYDTILQYLYKHSNSSYFQALRKESNNA